MLPIVIGFLIFGTTKIEPAILQNIEAIRRYFPEPEKTLEIAKIFHCESGLQHWNKHGELVVSKTGDVGISQINLKTWQKKANELGQDLSKIDGNLAMARYIYDLHGSSPWVCKRLLSG